MAGAVLSLRQSGGDLGAELILVLSTLLSLLSAALLILILTLPSTAKKLVRLVRFVRAISKGPMADAIAVGVLIALLAAKGTANLSAVAGLGSSFSAAYSLVSNLAFQLLALDAPRATAAARRPRATSPSVR